jgi:hypothetical protein
LSLKEGFNNPLTHMFANGATIIPIPQIGNN